MPAPADQTFLAWDRESGRGSFPTSPKVSHPPTPPNPNPPASARAFLLVGTVQTCCFSGAFERSGLGYGIGPMTKAIPKRVKDPNKSEPVHNAVLSAG